MAFSGGMAASGGPASLAPAQGDDVAYIEPEGLGFLGLSGDAQLRLTPKWDTLPPPTASLLAVAPRSGWLAAAGPDCIILADTKSVREAFKAKPESPDGKIRPFKPTLRISMPTRLTHVVFTVDEQHLVVASESEGSLIVFEAKTLLSGSTQPSFQISTNGEPLRYLSPNPSVDRSDLVAAVTTNGKLLVANLQTRSFEGVSGPTGGALRNNISCVAWSTKGKQLVAGSADGTIHQMTPAGDAKAELPRPLDLEGDCHVDSISWLENDLFFATYVSSGQDKRSEFRIVTRQGGTATFQKADNVNFPSDFDRIPHNSVMRLKDWSPALQDMLIISSSVSQDIGILTRARSPLSSSNPSVVNVFAVSPPLDGSRHATVPQNDDWEDTWVLGASVDMSSDEKVYQPIKDDPEVEESPGPLPAYFILTHEGVLNAWWIVYDDSVRQGHTYSGMASAAPSTPGPGTGPAKVQPSPFGGSTAASPFGGGSNTASPFGGAAAAKPTVGFGSSSALGHSASPWGSAKAAASPFGGAGSSAASPFGGAAAATKAVASPFGGSGNAAAGASASTASPFASSSASQFGKAGFGSAAAPAASAFGQPSALGGSALAPTPAFGQASALAKPAFGQSSALGGAQAPAFGQSSALGGLGGAKSAWGTGSTAPTSAFGQPSFGAAAAQSKPAVGAGAAAVTTGGGAFSSFANKGGFGSLTPAAPGKSAFAQAVQGTSSFKSDVSMGTSFGGLLKQPADKTDSGLSSGSFKLQSSFTRDSNDKDVDEEPADKNNGGDILGSGFGSALNVAAAELPAKEVDMEAAQTTPKPAVASLAVPESTTPTTTPAPSRFSLPAPAAAPAPAGPPQTSNIFGTKPSEEPKQEASSTPFSGWKPATSIFAGGDTTKDKATSIFGQPQPAAAPSGGLFSNVGKETPGSSIFGSTKATAPKEPKVDFTPQPPPQQPQVQIQVPSSPPVPPESTKTKSEPTLAMPKAAPVSVVPETTKEVEPEEEEDETEDESDENQTPAKKQEPPALYSVPSVPDSLEEEYSEAGGESEGSGVDVAKDLSPPVPVTKTPGFTPQSSFGGMGGSTFSSVSRPEQPSRLFGEVPRNAPALPKPSMFTSPRSPSPVRNVQAPMPGPPALDNLRASDMRSVSAPGMASQILGRKPQAPTSAAPNQQQLFQQSQQQFQQSQQQKQKQSNFGASIMGKVAPAPNLMEPHLKAKARKDAEEAQILPVDEEDDHIQKLLATEPEPTTTLDEFIAHGLTEPPAGESVGAQVEAVYRDINCMVDTLGINARSLRAFVKAHDTTLGDDERRTREDLEVQDDWVLCEVDDLNEILEVELRGELIAMGEVLDAEEKRGVIGDLARDMARLRARQEDLKRGLAGVAGVEKGLQSRGTKGGPLSEEQVGQQAELRKGYASFARSLVEAEEGLVLLKARIASLVGEGGGGGDGFGNSVLGGQQTKVPTVDAVIRTILKMTSMAEKRSGDVDVLESQVRKLRLAASVGPDGGRSREGSPFVGGASVGTSGRGHTRGVLSGSVLGGSLMFSPGKSAFGVSVVGTPGTAGTPRRKISGFSEEERRELMERRRGRKGVLGKLRGSLEKVGGRVVPL